MDDVTAQTIATLKTLVVSREKSIAQIAKDIANLKSARANALPVAAVALTQQLKVKEQRQERLVAERDGLAAELARLEQPELPGTSSPAAPAAKPPTVRKA